MGITMFGIGGLLAPLQSLVSWLAYGRGADAPAGRRSVQAWQTRPQAGRHTKVEPPASCRTRPSRPLRVVRVVDGSRSPAAAGRMVISGRFADVCAELDRLASLEANAR